MPFCVGFSMRAGMCHGVRHSGTRTSSDSAKQYSRLHAASYAAWNAREILPDCVVWTETPEASKSVTLYEQIGEGNFGAVFRGIENETGEQVAVKKILTRNKDVPGSHVAPFKIDLEAEIHQSIHDSPAVASMRAHVRADGADCLVTEYCEGGDLEQFSRRNGPLEEAQLAKVAGEGTRLLRKCHENEILHGDIKAANFVIKSAEDASKLTTDPSSLRPGWLKGIDFGCSLRMGKDLELTVDAGVVGKGRCTLRVGTPMNWPPEVFQSRFGLAADMWSFGTMLYFLASGRMPYFTAEEMENFDSEFDIVLCLIARELLFDGPAWKNYSDAAKDFVKRLLELEEMRRMTSAEAARHPFLRR